MDGDDAGVVPCVEVDDRPGPVGRAVVDGIDLLDVRRDPVQGLLDQGLLIIRRHHHRDPLPAVPWSRLCRDRTPALGRASAGERHALSPE